MNLNIQFEIILISFLFGIFFMIFYDLFNAIFYFKKGKILRLPFEILFFLAFSFLFFLLTLKICNAKLNIFIILFLFFGVLFYIAFLRYYFLSLYNFIVSKIKLKLFHIKNRIAIIKAKRKKKSKNEENIEPEKSN